MIESSTGDKILITTVLKWTTRDGGAVSVVWSCPKNLKYKKLLA